MWVNFCGDVCWIGSSLVFFCSAALANMSCRLIRSVSAYLSRWRSRFVCRAAAMSCAAVRMVSAAVTVGFEIYLCFKNTMPDIIVACVLLIHMRQQ